MKEMFEGMINPWNKIIRNLSTGSEINGGRGWPYDSYKQEKNISPEKYTVSTIRGIIKTDNPTENNDYRVIMEWMSDPEVARHLRAPIHPISLKDFEAIPEALRKIDRYYYNRSRTDENGNIIYDKPEKITPLIAVNSLEEPIATLVIRWKGNPLVGSKKIEEQDKDKRNIASIENIIVEPKLQSKHVGTVLMAAALDVVFYRYKGYKEKIGADLVRLWIFTDPPAGDYSKNINLVRQLGFDSIGSDKGGTWREYAAARGMSDARDGQQYELTKERWEEMKREDAELEHPRLVLPLGIINEESLRIPHLSNGIA